MMRSVDYPGIVIFAAAIIALLLGLQFGGSTYTWSDRRTIACLVVTGVLALILVLVEWRKGDKAIIPANVLCKREVSLSCLYTVGVDGAYFILTYQVRECPLPNKDSN